MVFTKSKRAVMCQLPAADNLVTILFLIVGTYSTVKALVFGKMEMLSIEFYSDRQAIAPGTSFDDQNPLLASSCLR